MSNSMTPNPPAGWYPDPSQAPQMRYWDGDTWTMHTAPFPASMNTVEHVRYAGWWSRFFAAVFDLILLALVLGVIRWPGTETISEGTRLFVERTLAGELLNIWEIPGFASAYLFLFVVQSLAYIAYHTITVVFLHASLGKYVLGLRVESASPVAEGERFPWKVALLRAIMRTLFFAIPLVNLVNGLSPLWRAKKASFHDSVAKTWIVQVKQ